MNERARKEEKGRRFVIVLVISVAVFVSFMLSFFLGQSGILRLSQMQNEYDRALIENQKYVLENKRLAGEIRKLRRDPAAIEKIAREELHFVSPHDIVLLVPSHHHQ
jgi:cell division protein FtsB